MRELLDTEGEEWVVCIYFLFFFLILNFYIFQTYRKVAKAEQKYSYTPLLKLTTY